MKSKFKIKGLDCANCAAELGRAIQKLKGIERASISFMTQRMELEYEETKKEVLAELKKQFRPEFINRIDEIIVFHKLTDDEISSIIDIMLNEVQKRLQDSNIEIKIDKSVKELIAKEGTNKSYGARPLRRTIQNLLEDKIAEAILDGKVKPEKVAKISAKEGNVVIK